MKHIFRNILKVLFHSIGKKILLDKENIKGVVKRALIRREEGESVTDITHE